MFLKNTLAVFVSLLGMTGLSFLSKVILARVLGPEGTGQFSLLITFVYFAMTISNLSIDSAVIYYLGRNKGSKQQVLATGFWLQVGLASVVVILISWVGYPWVNSTLFQNQVSGELILFCVIVLLPLTAINNALSLAYVGLNEIIKSTYFRIIGAGLQFTSMIVLLIGFRAGVFGALLASVLSVAVVSGLEYIGLRKLGYSLAINVPRNLSKSLLLYGVKGWVGNILQQFNYRLDSYVVNYFLGAALVGQYSIAVTVGEMIWLIPAAITTVLFPKTAANWDEATKFTPLVSRITVLVTVMAAIGLAVISNPLVRFVFGRDFTLAVPALLALLPGIVFLSVGKVVASDLAGRGKPQYGTYSAFCSLILTFVFDFLLIPRIGITGAAIASSLSYGLSSLILVYLYVSLSGNSVTSLLLVRLSDIQIGVDAFAKYKTKLKS